MKLNYFLSGWIANLGVVPLFSFAFFLALPVDFTLFFLIILVCLVRDPILYPLSIQCYLKNTNKFLSLLALVVKVFVFTNDTLCFAQEESFKDIFLSKGEQSEILAKSLKSFSVGNKEVLKYKYMPTKSQIIIKAKSIGFSDLVIWNTRNEVRKYRIYVTSKRTQLKKMELLSSLADKNINIALSGGLTHITGTVKDLKIYKSLKYLQGLKRSDLSIDVSLDNTLKHQIFESIYHYLLSRGASYVFCDNLSINITCEYKLNIRTKIHFEEIKNKFQIRLENLSDNFKQKNIKLKFNIISLDTSNIFIQQSGINRIEFNLKELIDSNKINLNSHNAFLQGDDFQAKILTSQQVFTTLNNPFQISVGADIPFRSLNQSTNSETINWKFSGLKIKGVTKNIEHQLALEYSSELTSPDSEVISGPKSRSTLFINQGETQLLYSSKIQTQRFSQSGIPLLSQIPVLKNLFISSEKSLNNKIILCFVTFVGEDDE